MAAEIIPIYDYAHRIRVPDGRNACDAEIIVLPMLRDGMKLLTDTRRSLMPVA